MKKFRYPTLYFHAPDIPKPCGGIRTRYRHVDILNKHGLSAVILHTQPGFRCTWFENKTPVTSFSELKQVNPHDIIVLPEIYGPKAHKIADGLLKKVIFNQGIFNTFSGHSLEKDDLTTPYASDEVIAIVVNSAHAVDYMQYAFPGKPVYRIHLAIDTEVYKPLPKKKQIAFITKKNMQDILQVINILKHRGALKNWILCPIDNKSELDAAQMIGESAFFLNFSTHEGFGKPAVEALASECVVVGYDAISGREYMNRSFAFPVPHGDVLAFAQKTEFLLEQYQIDPAIFIKTAKHARAFVQKEYNPLREESDLLATWQAILNSL